MATKAKTTYDVVICGGGAVGSSIALQLKLRDAALKVCVVERDPRFERCSATLSAGGLRQQFGLAENVALSMYGAEWLQRGLREAVGEDFCDPCFRENGYLTLASARSQLAHATQLEAGAEWIRMLSASELELRFPWLCSQGLEAGAFGERNEGFFDAHSLLRSTVAGAKRRGVHFLEAHVTRLHAEENVLRHVETADGQLIGGSTFALAAGAGSRSLLEDVPVAPRLRSIFVVHCDDEARRPPSNCPLVVDPSGVYFRADDAPGRFLCGVSPPPDWPDPDVDAAGPLTVDYALFEDVVWPTLAHRVPAFESLKLQSAWAGLYEVHDLDHNALIGFHPRLANLLVAAGFSGHGLQHSPGVGRAVAELLTTGAYQTIDLAPFSFERLRVEEGGGLREYAIY